MDRGILISVFIWRLQQLHGPFRSHQVRGNASILFDLLLPLFSEICKICADFNIIACFDLVVEVKLKFFVRVAFVYGVNMKDKSELSLAKINA